jgi:dihydrofolate reductase
MLRSDYKMKMPEIIIIAAIDQNNGLGFNNHLLCHLHDDLKNFKKLTSGHTVVMGRKTWESLSVKPLPNRKNIVLSRQNTATFQQSIASTSMNEVLKLCADEEKVFIIGGAEIYRQFFEVADRLVITHIQYCFISDVFFPLISDEKWKKINEMEHIADEKHAYAFTVSEYIRHDGNLQ